MSCLIVLTPNCYLQIQINRFVGSQSARSISILTQTVQSKVKYVKSWIVLRHNVTSSRVQRILYVAGGTTFVECTIWVTAFINNTLKIVVKWCTYWMKFDKLSVQCKSVSKQSELALGGIAQARLPVSIRRNGELNGWYSKQRKGRSTGEVELTAEAA